MKSLLYSRESRVIVLFSAFLFFSLHLVVAQSAPEAPPKDIFEALSKRSEETGDILIRQPQQLRKLVGKVAVKEFVGEKEGEKFNLTHGYRIQAYNGNLPNSKQEAYQRANTLSKLFPGQVCYITYRAPFWRLVMGDYATIEEAREALSDLKRVAPSAMISEFYIVKDKIRTQH